MASTLLQPSDILFVSDQQPLTLATMNGIFNQFIQSINGVLTRMDGYDNAVQNLVNLGLANINSTLGPFLTTLQQAAQLGFLVAEADGTTLSLQVGQPFNCVMTSNGASLFTPTLWLMALDVNDSTNWGILQLVNWVHTNLNLTTTCIYASKTKSSSSWQICCGSGVLNAMVNDLNAATTAATNAQAANTSAQSAQTFCAGVVGSIQAGSVVSVSGHTGVVNLVESDISGLTSDLSARPTITYLNNQLSGVQPHSATLDQLSALALSSFITAFLSSANASTAMSTLGAATLSSPAFTGAPSAPTPTAGDNSTRLATTAFDTAAIAAALTAYTPTSGLPTAIQGTTINSSQIAAAFDDQTGTTYSFTAADSGKQVTLTNAAAITATLPNNLAKGWNCLVWQGGAGQVAFSPASGATLRNRQSLTHTAGQYAMASLMVMSNSNGVSAVYALGGDCV
jgi:hypothetical protein